MNRLVVVSNRVASTEEGVQQTGGLAAAMADALRRSGGLWFGWSGNTAEGGPGAPAVADQGATTVATIDLSPDDVSAYYDGFANSTLWPLFHFRLGLIAFSRANRDGYMRVNEAFADALVPLLRPDDRIWVHDYHLIPLGDALRRRGVRQPIGFFLHTPLPPAEMMAVVPGWAELMGRIGAYDLVGLQTRGDLDALTGILRRMGLPVAAETDGARTLRTAGRTMRAEVHPIAIDTAGMAGLAEAAETSRNNRRLAASLMGRRLVIGVDRLDYSKGLPQRFEAFGRLLETRPEHRGRVSFLQIAPPTRAGVAEYRQLRRELEGLAGHINGRFATFDWVPIRYMNTSFGRRTLAGFYRAAQVGLVTPLRDGMNLVAKEYAASQRPDDPGVLVLSRFAGAACELGSALLVNPFDVEEIADAIDRALAMDIDERRSRAAAALDVLRRHDVTAWRAGFLRALDRCAVPA